MESLEDLDNPRNYDELRTIISKVNFENTAGDALFLGKYQVLLLENLFPWQKQLGKFFQATIAICGAKLKQQFQDVSEINESEIYSPEADGGCPLPLIFDSLNIHDNSSTVSVLKHLKEKYTLYPLPRRVGMKILSMCTSKHCQMTYPLIVMCHDINPKAVAILGTLIQDKSIRVSVTNKGFISRQEQLPKFLSVKQIHLMGFVPSHTPVEISVFARYDFLQCLDNSLVQPSKNMSAFIECYWSNAAEILEPLPTECKCFANIKASDGDVETGAFSKFSEIKLIMALHESRKTGVMKWLQSPTNGKLMKRAQDFMTEEQNALFSKSKNIPTVIKLESFDKVVTENRSNLDFTDKLWLLLKDCSSSEELMEVLLYVFTELSGFFAPPYVYHKNVSSIAMLIKNMRESSMMVPVLNCELAIQMLLEIGIEKLRKDYIALFVGLELAPYDCMNYFLHPDIRSVEAANCLRKLHTTLELTIVCLKCLSLPEEILSEFVRSTLKHYSSEADVDLQHTFKFQVPPVIARNLLNQMRPTVWEISLQSSHKGYLKQSVHHFSTTPTPEQVYAPKGYHPKLLLKTASYVYLTGTLIEDDNFC